MVAVAVHTEVSWARGAVQCPSGVPRQLDTAAAAGIFGDGGDACASVWTADVSPTQDSVSWPHKELHRKAQ
eukprot:1768645-Pyramimonas_sp.AAC.1